MKEANERLLNAANEEVIYLTKSLTLLVCTRVQLKIIALIGLLRGVSTKFNIVYIRTVIPLKLVDIRSYFFYYSSLIHWMLSGTWCFQLPVLCRFKELTLSFFQYGCHALRQPQSVDCIQL